MANAASTAWRRVWRLGIAPKLYTGGLLALRRALVTSDPELVQGVITEPAPFGHLGDFPVTAACAVAYAGWKGEKLETVAEVEEFFARVCSYADQTLGEPAAIRYFIDWFDETPADRMRLALLAEVTAELRRRSPRTPEGGMSQPLVSLFHTRIDDLAEHACPDAFHTPAYARHSRCSPRHARINSKRARFPRHSHTRTMKPGAPIWWFCTQACRFRGSKRGRFSTRRDNVDRRRANRFLVAKPH
jgi:hypothetical protein